MNTCQLCKRTFRSARTLESHTNSFHKKSVKKIKCMVRPKAFSSYGDYFRHRKNDHNLPLLPESNEINRSNSENNSLKSFTNARKVQRNDPGNDDVDEDQLTIDEFDSTFEKSHNKRFRADNSLDTKNISEYGESTDHRGCLLEIIQFFFSFVSVIYVSIFNALVVVVLNKEFYFTSYNSIILFT